MQRNDGLNSPAGDSEKPKRRVVKNPRSAKTTAQASPKAKSVKAGQSGVRATPDPEIKVKGREAAIPRLLEYYRKDVRSTLMKEFNYHSVMRAPQVQRVVLNMGLGEALTNARTMETAPEQMGMIAGQKPIITKARRSVAAFKVREGQPIGCAVTLRGRRMWDFLDRFLAIALPRIRDFRGVPRSSFDGQGNYSVGIREQIIFPEIDYNRLDRVRGLQVNIVTSAQSDHEGFRLLELLGMPFAREGQQR
jgi:large subunit ribosomal protein L5